MAVRPFQDMTAPEAERFMATKQDQRIRAIVAGRIGNRDVIDLGCGRGIHISRDYSPKQYIGLDCSHELIKLARKANPGYAFEVWDIKHPYKVTSEVALIKSVLEHQESLEDARAIFDVAQRTAPEVLICWHTPPEGQQTIIRRVDAELDHPIYQNVYQQGSFDDLIREDSTLRTERLGEFQLWTIRRRGLRSDH